MADISTAERRCKIAVSESDRLNAFRLRYEVYIAEQRKSYAEANVGNRTLTDGLDQDGCIIVVTDAGDAVVGTVRANWLSSPSAFSRYARELELSRFSHLNTANIAVCSRLAALPEHRHSRVRELLFQKIYEVGLERGTKLCFATCAPSLLRLFARYGFREYATPVQDRVVGTLHRTVLVLEDLEHLVQVSSPFASIARARAVVPPERSWVARLFAAELSRRSEAI